MRQLIVALVLALLGGAALAQAAPTKRVVGVDPWLDAMIESAERIAAAVRTGDADELRRQDRQVHQHLLKVLKWPEHAAWTQARAHCTLMTQELANFLADVQKGTPEGRANAKRSFNAAEGARKECSRGIASLK